MDNKINIDSAEKSDIVVVKAKPVRRIYKGASRTIHKIPQSILNDPKISDAISALPQNYNFEIHKTIWRVREMKAKRVALQMPEGKNCYINCECKTYFRCWYMLLIMNNIFHK